MSAWLKKRERGEKKEEAVLPKGATLDERDDELYANRSFFVCCCALLLANTETCCTQHF